MRTVAKSPTSYRLSVEVIDQLKRLAVAQKRSQVAILESFIAKEIKKIDDNKGEK